MAGEKVGSIYYDLDLDDGRFKNKAANASSQLQGLTGSFQAAEKASFALMAGLAAAAGGIVAVGLKGIQAAGQMETARAGFITLLGSAEKADKTIARIKKEAARTPFEIPGLTSAVQALALVTKDGDKSIDLILDLGKALAAAGKGQVELDRLTANLQQIALTGKITAMDMKQFGTNGINITELLAKSLRKTTRQIGVMQDEGRITFKMLTDALHKAGAAGGQFEKAFENQGGTFEQTLSNMNDSLNMFFMDLVVQSGAFEAVKKALAGVTDMVNKLSDEIAKAGGIGQYLNKVFNENKETIYIISGAIMGALVPALASLALSAAAAVLPLLPFVAIGAAIALVIFKLQEAFGGIEPLITAVRNALQQMWNIIAPFIVPFLSEMARIIREELWPALQQLWTMLQPHLVEALKVVAMIFGGMLLASIVSIMAVILVLVKVVTVLVQVFKWLVEQWQGGMNLMKKQADDFKNGVKDALDKVKGFWDTLVLNVKYIVGEIEKVLKPVYDAIVKPFVDAFGTVKQEATGASKHVKRNLDPFQRQSPSMVDLVTAGTQAVSSLYSGMFSNLQTMSTNVHRGMNVGVASTTQTIQKNEAPMAAGGVNITVAPQGIIATSRSQLREIGRDMLEAVDEELESRGMKPLIR